MWIILGNSNFSVLQESDHNRKCGNILPHFKKHLTNNNTLQLVRCCNYFRPYRWVKNVLFKCYPSCFLIYNILSYFSIKLTMNNGEALPKCKHICPSTCWIMSSKYKDISLSTLDVAMYLKSLVIGDKDPFVLQRQCHGRWWPDDTRNQAIDSYGIKLLVILQKYAVFRNKRVIDCKTLVNMIHKILFYKTFVYT